MSLPGFAAESALYRVHYKMAIGGENASGTVGIPLPDPRCIENPKSPRSTPVPWGCSQSDHAQPYGCDGPEHAPPNGEPTVILVLDDVFEITMKGESDDLSI